MGIRIRIFWNLFEGGGGLFERYLRRGERGGGGKRYRGEGEKKGKRKRRELFGRMEEELVIGLSCFAGRGREQRGFGGWGCVCMDEVYHDQPDFVL